MLEQHNRFNPQEPREKTWVEECVCGGGGRGEGSVNKTENFYQTDSTKYIGLTPHAPPTTPTTHAPTITPHSLKKKRKKERKKEREREERRGKKEEDKK